MTANATNGSAASPTPGGRKPYQRKKTALVRVALNEFQKDVVLSAIRREVERIRAERSIPESLKILAIRELNSVLVHMDEPPLSEALPDKLPSS